MHTQLMFGSPVSKAQRASIPPRGTPGALWGLRRTALVVQLALLPGTLLVPLHAQDTATAAGPLHVTNAVEVVKRWQASQRLYVKGELGVGEAQLVQLEQWLDQNAINWTVLLAESAQGETFRDASGEFFTGMDAVEHALGKGLPNQTGFGQLTDVRTGERNGAFFVLFLRERKFSYFGSDAQDRHGVGEDRWVGRLDQPAIAAMRSGGRIVDAVKDTISSIDRQLSQNLAAEQQRREQKEAAARAERQRVLEQAKAGLQSATGTVDRLAQKQADLLHRQPDLSGDIARPDLPSLQADLVAAQAALDSGNSSAAAALADSVQQRALTAVRAIEDYLQAPTELDAVDQSLKQTATHPFSQAVKTDLAAGEEALKQARLAHDRADSAYVAALAAARQHAHAAETRAATAAAAAEEARQRALDAARLKLQLTLAGTIVSLLGLVALGAVLNRRRRGSMQEALALIEAWTKALDEKTLALLSLLERTQRLVGASSDEAAQRYAGETLRLSRQIIHDVDELMIMSACATRILNEAKALATPTNAGARLINLFAAAKYRGALHRLRDELIVFHPEEGLELAFRGAKSERERLLGSLESYQPFKYSFNELIEGFNQRAERALSLLDQVETSLTQGGSLLEATQQTLHDAQLAESEIQATGNDDGIFLVAPVFVELLPSAHSDLAEAVKASVRDPVGALQTHGASARQKADDALALAQLARDFQQAQRPDLRGAAAQLEGVPLKTDWLAAAVSRLSSNADDLARRALKASAAPGIAVLRDDLNSLVERAARTVDLDRARREVAQKSIEDTETLVDLARRELARPLGKTADVILREPDRDPSERLAQAREQMAGVKAALERGDVAASQGGLDAVAHWTAEAAAIVEATRGAFGGYPGTLEARRRDTDRLLHQVPEHESILAGLQSRYLPEALQLGEGDPTHPNGNGTVQDNLQEVHQHLTKAKELADRAEHLFHDAQILQAAETLAQTAAHQELAGFRLEEIVEKQQRLRQTGADNEALEQHLQNRIRELEPTVNDPRSMEPTLQAFESAAQALAAAGRLRSATPCNPFQVAAEFEKVRERLERVADEARCGWDLYAEADRSLKAAAAQLETAGTLSSEATSDNVVDSPAILQARQSFELLSAQYTQAQAKLPVPHGDWQALDAEADRIASEAGQVAATLRGELQAARSALTALTGAATHVRTAGAWTGGLGVMILGAPGSDLLNQARALLNRGDYPQAWRRAEAARQAAQTAIAEAEAEVRRRRRAEEERRERERRQREEAERRRRMAISTSHFGSGASGFGRSGFGSGVGISHSSFHSGSGVSHSSFHGGSGASRSGW